MKNLIDLKLGFAPDAVLFDFDGVFTDNHVYIDQNGYESVRCSRLDGFGLASLRRAGVHIAVLTTETKPIARLRCEKLKVPCFDSLDDKLQFATQYLPRLGYSLEKTIFVGNDINDLELLRNARIGVVPSDCYEHIKIPEFYITRRAGGCGCVRELCDHLLRCN